MVATQTIPIRHGRRPAPRCKAGFCRQAWLDRAGNVTGLSGMDAEAWRQNASNCSASSSRTSLASRYSHRAYRPIRFSRPFVDDMQSAATIAGIRLVPVLVNDPKDFEKRLHGKWRRAEAAGR